MYVLFVAPLVLFMVISYSQNSSTYLKNVSNFARSVHLARQTPLLEEFEGEQ